MLFRIQLITPLLVAFLLSHSLCNAQQSIEVRGRTMGPIPFKVLVVTEDSEVKKLKAVQSAVNDSLQRVNELMSTYLEDSDISKFNRTDANDWQTVDSETATVVSKALEICKLTDGAFDPTVGPLVKAWNFGPDKKDKPELPSAEQIKELMSLVGYQNIEVRSDPPAIRKRNPKAQLDLSAIAKGYAVDRVGRSLKQLGYENFMVEVGGEVLTFGERASGGSWNVGIEKPNSEAGLADSERSHRVVELSGQAVATSGDYRNFIDIDGQRYSHTIDPRTGRPVTHNMAVASVIAEDCMTADALATAMMVMGSEKGAELCAKLSCDYLTISRSESDDGLPLITEASENFPLVEETAKAKATQAIATEELKSAKSSRSEILPVFIATFVVFCLMILGMAVGAIFNNKPVTGSCGGIANMTNEDGEAVCGICSKPTIDCEETVA
jgi:thiamine biosynthesis lipoprotein